MIEELRDFVQSALEDTTGFKNVVATNDRRFANSDAHPPAAIWAIKIDDIQNLNQDGSKFWLFVRILILLADHRQDRATEKLVDMHSRFTGKFVDFSDARYWQEDLFRLVEGTPEVLVNTHKEYSLGIEYEGKITVDTTQ